MTENQVGFLFNIAFKLPSNNEVFKKLKSHYLMRCNEVTRGFGLPTRQFSIHARCPHCCSEWSRDTDIKLKPANLSKSKHQRIKIKKPTDDKKNHDDKKHGMHLNEMIRTCTFCLKSTTTLLTKPRRNYHKPTSSTQQTVSNENPKKLDINDISSKKAKQNKESPIPKPQKKKDFTVNLYTNAHDIFSLKNDKNTLTNTNKPSKVIKNNKKKKDKFAGLSQKAVLASAKLKKEIEDKKKSDNKLSLFLKPSSA